ncbi:MAG: hypothetical protein JXA14_26365, partial [Anaerolineae bacterium]|nr:hypothetical protein [Anaerolineae bacterium]
NWIVAGPQAIPVTDLERFEGEDRLQIAHHYYEEDSGIGEPPVDWGKFTMGDTELKWTYIRCQDDHFVDLTAFYHTCHYLRSWAYARVASPTTQEVTLVLTTNGPADVWLNGEHVHRQEHFHRPSPHSVSFQTTLQEGQNEILVRFEEVAARDCPYAMALQVLGLPEDTGGADIFIPVPIEAVARRKTLENVFYAAYLERDVYVYDEKIKLSWLEDMAESASLTVRVQTPEGRIYSESQRMGASGNYYNIGNPYQLREDYYQALLMPQAKEYYEGNMRITRRIGLRTVKNRYSQEPYGTYMERRVEALYDAFRRETGIYSEIAKMAVGRWHDIKTDVFMEAIEGINQRGDCSDFYMVGLLGMLHRYGDHPEFPENLREPLEECILNFKYWADEPGEDVMWYWSENHQILFHACEILAGQLYPDRTFTNAGQTGQWHREKGERLALAWLHKRGIGGFQEWDSNCYFEEDLLALSHLADLAETPQVYEMAAVVMDKMFFTMALNSFKGVFGSTHGRTYTPMIRGGRLEPTAGIGRLMWGMGAFNPHIRGVVSLAIQEDYQLPAIIEAIAADLPEEMWNRERHAGEFEEALDRTTGSWEVNKVTYKTPDYMLCSAQDYRPGERGSQQHIWQATLGPDAVVFVTHPACCSEEGSHRPNFWHGNVVLPRVAQWKDVLVAVHKLPEDDWMGFTHAYFPAVTFDEYVLREDAGSHMWAFARKEAGYLAITASQEMELIKSGDSAYRELRSYGQQNVWLCHMGRAARDGSFEEFQEKVLALDVTFEDLSVRCATLRGETLAFGWEGPLLRDGEEEPITGFRHYDNPYCVAELPAEQMVIRYGDQAMRLNFEK